MLRINHYLTQPISPSHIDGREPDNHPEKEWLTLAILSDFDIVKSSYTAFTTPTFSISKPNERTKPIPQDERHEKGILLAELSNGLYVATTQLLPAKFLGFDYLDGPGARLAAEINTTLLDVLPLVGNIYVGADLNFDESADGAPSITQVFPAFTERNMRSIFDRDETTVRVRTGRAEEAQGFIKPDYMFVSGDINVTNRQVVRSTAAGPIKFDHFVQSAEVLV